MKLKINGQQVESSGLQNLNLGQALHAVQDEYIDEGEVLAGILVDGELLSPQSLRDWKERPADDFDVIDVGIEACNKFAASGLRMIHEHLAQSAVQREKIVDSIQQGLTQEAMEALGDYLQVWNAVQATLASACRLMNVKPEELELFESSVITNPQSKSFTVYLDELTKQLTEVKSALEAGDLVMLGDVLDYEFGDLTDIWQNVLLQIAEQFDPQE